MTYIKVSKYFNHQNKIYIDMLAIDGNETDDIDSLGVPYIKCNEVLWHLMVGDGMSIDFSKYEGVKFIQYKESFKSHPACYLFNCSDVNKPAAQEAIAMIFEFKTA